MFFLVSGGGLKALERARPAVTPLSTLFHDADPLMTEVGRTQPAQRQCLKTAELNNVGKIA